MRTLGVAAFVTLLPLLLTAPGRACQCGAMPAPAEALAAADVAFVGRVVETWPIAVRAEGYEGVGLRSTLRVDARLEGAPRAEERLVYRGGCTARFDQGEAYLVFAHRAPDGTLEASLCSPTRRIGTFRAADLLALGVPRSALDGGPVPAENPVHRALRSAALATLVAIGAGRTVWAGWADSASGLVPRLAATLALAAAAPVLFLLLRRRRFRLAAQVFLGGPLAIAIAALLWAWWFVATHAWLAELAR